MKNLGFRVPLAIVNKAHQANQLYPFAISLIESVRTYERTLEKVRHFAMLCALERNKEEKGVGVEAAVLALNLTFRLRA